MTVLSKRVACLAILLSFATTALAVDEKQKADSAPNDVLTRALVDELERSMNELSLGALPRPYFIQFNVQDRWTLTMSAAYGGLLNDNDRRDRILSSRVRVGSFEIDNTNIGQPYGGVGRLPIDNDYTALRHAIWRIVDMDYKAAVETLTAKHAYLEDHHVENRPDDYTPAKPVVHADPFAKIDIDRAAWCGHVETLSARFKKYPAIQDSSVTFFAGTADEWVVNSEGTRIRTDNTGVLVRFDAELQAADGMPLADSEAYLGLSVEDLPDIDEMLIDLDEMCVKLIALSKASTIDHYTGPVLFEPVAAGQAFQALLADHLCAQPVPLGSGWEDQSFENRVGLRILPRSFHVYDDPREPRFEGEVLAGAYLYDSEAVRATRVSLIESGVLKTLVAARAPTRKIKGSTGHGRNPGYGDAQASIGCMYVESDDGLDPEPLKQELFLAAREEGLDHALRIERMEDGAYGAPGAPIYAYKVSVDGEHEELVRGLEFLEVTPRAMKRLLAAGKRRLVHNAMSQVSSTFIAPAILFEELDLAKTSQEFEKPPILPSPGQRRKDAP